MYKCILKGTGLHNGHWFCHIPCILPSIKTYKYYKCKKCRALSTNKDIVVVVVVVVVTYRF